MLDVSEITLFRHLSSEELAVVKSKVIGRTYPKGSTVFVEGQGSDGIYIVASGLVKVFMLNRDGREKTLTILKQGELLGEMTLYGIDRRSATVETMELTTFYIISQSDFQFLLQEIPKLATGIIEILSLRLRQANRQIQELSFLNSRSRVICNLVHLSEVHGYPQKNGSVSLSLTHVELAKLAGVSRETVTKVISELQEAGLVKAGNRRVTIQDLENLYRQVM